MNPDMDRIYHLQGAIVRNHHILLICNREIASGREYWLIPGGGMEEGGKEEEFSFANFEKKPTLR
jgi:ADP-ribose pyrophosphatase YjhB (NUDIX family)